MACLHVQSASGAVIHLCGISPLYRLALLDGRRVYMDWHYHLGPTFFHDRCCQRVMDDWWKDDFICRALEWYIGRGERA